MEAPPPPRHKWFKTGILFLAQSYLSSLLPIHAVIALVGALITMVWGLLENIPGPYALLAALGVAAFILVILNQTAPWVSRKAEEANQGRPENEPSKGAPPQTGSGEWLTKFHEDGRQRLANDPLKDLREGIDRIYRSWGEPAIEALNDDARAIIMSLNYDSSPYAWAAQNLLTHLQRELSAAEEDIRRIFSPYDEADSDKAWIFELFPNDVADYYGKQTAKSLVNTFLRFYLAYRRLAEDTARLKDDPSVHGPNEYDRQLAVRVMDLAGRAEFREVRESIYAALPKF